MTETLLVLHLLSAFALVAGVVIYSAVALGSPTGPGLRATADRLWDAGGFGTLVFGVWLAFDIGFYSITDGWILAALGLWVVIAILGMRARFATAPPGANGTVDAALTAEWGGPSVAVWHWLRVAFVLLLLAVMIWKPGA